MFTYKLVIISHSGYEYKAFCAIYEVASMTFSCQVMDEPLATYMYVVVQGPNIYFHLTEQQASKHLQTHFHRYENCIFRYILIGIVYARVFHFNSHNKIRYFQFKKLKFLSNMRMHMVQQLIIYLLECTLLPSTTHFEQLRGYSIPNISHFSLCRWFTWRFYP